MLQSEPAQRECINQGINIRHQHYDILYLGIIPEDVPFFCQEDEVDDIRWFDIEWIEKYIEEKRMLHMIKKIRTLWK